ncbi:hypothetical protein OsccyDRAFT_3548 [Leptolyngbyaceae cyanobacterium JSC-12]|nr:hypothetical protein OsccyDRAFT_3548 [Leptolyngbyaceae cyanobacterium JSC-12]
MKSNLKQTLTVWGCIGASAVMNFLPLAQPASAEVLARMHGRCKQMNDSVRLFDGHCIIKHKQQGNTTILSVELDNGSKYNFFGPNLEALQVQSYDGVHNVRFTGEIESGSFAWQEGGNRNRLAVKVDSQYPADVSYDSPQPVQPSKISTSGKIAAGVIGVGAVLAAILGNKNRPADTAGTTQADVQVGDSVPGLQDLVGARAGQAENTVRQRGYRFIKTIPSGDAVFSNWREAGTNSCVSIRTAEGRYASIVYATPADCDR